ncbi:exocyst complex component Sec3-domain-containing protein [Pseudomassariella vexata]|uniref:Exocyst complex component Sec3-domain-containing protein n=1 Tax=Pseudomassariella vexata TaxID=1141098 RepID=A0A1Y2DQJ5_9PEZI|nr:exocyst complex component Sec3-domain-containing protein [Pseudomassariella vexata]ORY61376.1 exocyst complex component Sec3-domain-containing protein [Pseudomassariella vexata]
MDASRGGYPRGRELSRAERFEEEKRRIVDSCFNKTDVDGSLLETYITHIKITEYSSHPSSPPPPESRTPQSEKPRVIIVAVRKSGRVRMHKSKENANGTFSIGKTWDLNDLTGIESFTGTTADAQKRQWASDTGFVINIGKPYYWQAQADKEKKFFIASLIKIYGKYTGGRTPDLIGFDPRELDQVLGSRKPAGRTPPASESMPSRPEPLPGAPSNVSLASNTAGTQAYQLPSRPPASPARNLVPPTGASASPSPSVDSGRVNNQAAPPLRRLAANNKSQDSVAASFSTARSDDANSLPPRSRGGMNGPGALGRFGDTAAEPPPPPPPQAQAQAQPPQPQSQPQPAAALDLPDRRRPPMDPGRPQGSVDRDLVPAPLISPGMRREPQSREPQPPPRSMERMSPRKNSVGARSVASSLREELSTAPEPPTLAPAPAPVTVPAPTPPPLVTNGDTPFASAVSSPPPETTESPVEGPIESPVDSRPGLGPMIKAKKSKGELAGALWKAASAAAVFKPRPGGAGERLRELVRKDSAEGPDGITSVVPAPSRPTPKPETPKLVEPEKSSDRNSGLPEVKITVPNSSRPSSLQLSKEKRKSGESVKKAGDVKDTNTSGNDGKYLTTLGVDTGLLDTQTTEFAKWLDHFGWVPGDKMRTRNFEEMKMDIDRELNKAQAGGWVVRFQDEDERVDAIKRGLDLAVNECEELDNLLTLYSVELSTLSDDIAYIEAQGQGLQVQAANQKLLKKELESLLDTCAIQGEDLQALEVAPLDSLSGLDEIEGTLVTLYKAMMKIDPTMDEAINSDAISSDQQSGFNSDYGQMRIVQEKKVLYTASSAQFLKRFGEFMDRQFDLAAREVKQSLDGALSKKVDHKHHDVGRELLWRYSPLMVYARDLDLTGWNTFIQTYQGKNFPLYKEEFREVVGAWRRNARKPTGEEAELLFTAHAEKQQESTMATARKLTVKRSQTLARSLRSPLGDGSRTNPDKTSDGRSLPYEVLAGIVDDLLPLVEIEQNFIIDFFHATTLENIDFPEAVAATRPQDRRSGDLRRHRLMEPDRELARRVTRAMEVIFSFLEQDLQSSVDWVLFQDPLQGVGVLAILERKHSEMSQSNQDFLNNVLQKLHSNLEARFSKFVEEQIRAIEDTKVKIKKRKGIISFFRVFPQFSSAIENMMSTAGASANSTARRAVDREYDRIIKSMFDSLKVIARENPATLTSSSADPEDKEALNYHILLIENMNHFVEEVDTHSIEILEDWKEAASSELAEHMSLYLNAVMRRPLGKLLEYLENIEAQLTSGKSAPTIAAQPSNSKGTFNKVLSGYDGREVKKGVEALKKRVEKHFGDDDEPNKSRVLVNRALKECERFYGDIEIRISTVTASVYGGDVLFEWPRAEVKSAFAGR